MCWKRNGGCGMKWNRHLCNSSRGGMTSGSMPPDVASPGFSERAPQTSSWRLVLSFRSAGPQRTSFWTPYPLVSASKTALFAQAEQISNDKLTAVLADHLR